jgi:lysyl-tRNA synthetase class 2
LPASPWWNPDRHADRRPRLLARNAITAATRAWFAARDFVEVEAAALQVSPGNEAHLHAFATEALTTAGERSPLYLHTSPEFAAKKLRAAGETRIVSLGRFGATASAGRFTIPSSPCWNGTGWASPMRR